MSGAPTPGVQAHRSRKRHRPPLTTIVLMAASDLTLILARRLARRGWRSNLMLRLGLKASNGFSRAAMRQARRPLGARPKMRPPQKRSFKG